MLVLAIVLIVVAVLLSAACQLAIPKLTGAAVNQAVGHDVSGLDRTLMIFAGVALGYAACFFVGEWLSSRLAQRVIFDIRRAMFAHFQDVSLSFMDKTHVGRIMARLQGDVNALQEFLENMNGALGDFVTLVAAVRQQMQPGGRYEFVDTHERETVETNLAAMQSLLDKYGTVAQMDMNTKIQLFNDQEIVNAILTRRDDKRLVCESVAPIGSHIPRTSCRTYREMELERRDVQNLKQQMLQVPAVRVPSGRPSSRGGNR